VSSLLGSITNSAQLVVNPANMDLGMYAGIVITGAAAIWRKYLLAIIVKGGITEA
jgi:hypothetical protein